MTSQTPVTPGPPPPTFNLTLHVPVSGFIGVHGNGGPTPTGQRGPLLPLPETQLVRNPPKEEKKKSPKDWGLGNVYFPHPVAPPSSVWSYMLS